MPISMPDEWQTHIGEILASPGLTVVVGNVDTGKTSFCTLLANRAFEAGVSTAVVDGDIGQSEIGPPTTVGLGIVESEIQTLGDLKPRKLYFVGATSPYGHLLPTVTGMRKMADETIAREKQLIIVDTPGMVRDVAGRKLHTFEIELLEPRHIVALQRASETEHFLKFFDKWEDCQVHRLPVAAEARPKTQPLRTQRRAVRFREYFHHGQTHELPLDSLATSGTWLGTGVPLEPKYMKFAEHSLKTVVYHGEIIDNGIYLVTKTDYNRHGISDLQEQFATKNIMIVSADRYLNLLVGLVGSHLKLLSLGIIRGIDFRTRMISVYTPLRSIAPVRSIRFGILKLRPEGTEIGRLRPGEF